MPSSIKGFRRRRPSVGVLERRQSKGQQRVRTNGGYRAPIISAFVLFLVLKISGTLANSVFDRWSVADHLLRRQQLGGGC